MTWNKLLDKVNTYLKMYDKYLDDVNKNRLSHEKKVDIQAELNTKKEDIRYCYKTLNAGGEQI